MALWIALALAFSPVALDLGQHLAANPWARYAVVFPLLFARLALRDDRRPRAPIGTLWIVAGLAWEVAMSFTGAMRWARHAPVLAAIGLCQREGIGSWRSRALLLFAVPVPAFVVKLGERGVASAMGEWAARVGSFGDRTLALTSSVIQSGADEVVAMNRGWISFAVLLAGLAWYDGALLRRPLPATVAFCAVAAALAWPIQALSLAAAVGVALLGATGVAQAWVNDGVWLSTALAGFAISEARLRRSDAVAA